MLALGVVGLIAAGSAGNAGAREVAWTPTECPAGREALVRALKTGSRTDDTGPGTWYRVDPRLDAGGRQVAQRLSVGGPAGEAVRSVELGAESFAAGPFGGQILTGSDDGRTSTIRLLDTAAGCARTVGTERDVVRRATVDGAGTSVYEFRVDRGTRADLGVWQRRLDGAAAPRRVLDPLPSDARFGRTFSTELSWSLEGDRLVVQSCGQTACRTRLFNPIGQTTTLLDDDDLGELIGVAGDRLVTYEACRGLPCPIVSVDVGSRSRTSLTDQAGLAVVVDTDAGPRIVHEDGGAGPGHLRVVDPNGLEETLIETDPGVRLVPGAGRAQAGVELPRGWLVLGPDARPGRDAHRLLHLRPSRQDATHFEEVLP